MTGSSTAFSARVLRCDVVGLVLDDVLPAVGKLLPSSVGFDFVDFWSVDRDSSSG